VGSLFISSIVQRVGRYKPIALVLMILSIIFVSLFYLAIASKNAYILYIDTFLVGLFVIPLIPVMLECSCEIIYPLSGSFAVGLLFSGATLLTVVSSQLLTIIIGGNQSDKWTVLYGCIVILTLFVLGFVAMFFVKETRNRSNEMKLR
jgi:FLVCR family feline leukemia virus subgroup C receptor-related protein